MLPSLRLTVPLLSDMRKMKIPNIPESLQEEAEALEAISKAGYEIEFALIKEASIGTWDKFRGQFGFN